MNEMARRMFSKRAPDSSTKIGLGVGVFLLDSQKRILLEKRTDCGLWGLLGGRIEVGESIEQSAMREVFEETGFRIQITRLIGVYSQPDDRIITYADNGDVVHKIDIILEASIVSGVLTRSNESEELRFFERNQLPVGDLAPPARKPVEDYVSGLAGVIS